MTDRAEAEALLASARSGSTEAWAALYRTARPQLFRYARIRLATDDQAEDAVSETMARAISAVDSYRPGAGPIPWLVGICRNVVFETYRSGGRTRSVDPEVMARERGASPDAGPAEQVVGDAEAIGLRKAFGRLRPEDQDLLSLRVVAGLSSEEVGVALDKRPGAVRMAQSRALDRLRALIEEDR